MQTKWLRGTGPDERGRGVLETLRWHGGPPPAWDHHQARWRRGLAAIGAQAVALDALLHESLSVFPADRVWRIRLLAYPNGAIELAWRTLTDDEQNPRPWSLQVMGLVADRPAHLADCKTTDLQTTQKWRTQAQAQGADEALLRGPENQWAEATTANLICGLMDGRIVTPWSGSLALPGTTLACLAQHLPVETTQLSDMLLPQVRWAVLTNAIQLVRAVSAIDGRTLSPPPAEILALRDRLMRTPMLRD